MQWLKPRLSLWLSHHDSGVRVKAPWLSAAKAIQTIARVRGLGRTTNSCLSHPSDPVHRGENEPPGALLTAYRVGARPVPA